MNNAAEKIEKINADVVAVVERPTTPLARKMRKGKDAVKVTHPNDPIAELRALVRTHSATQRFRVGVGNQAADGKNKETGALIACLLDAETRDMARQLGKNLVVKENALKAAMKRQLRQIPIYTEFFEKAFGSGEIVAAYFIAYVDIRRCEKSSSLRRFCGMAVIDGALERRTRGRKNAYCSVLRKVLYTWFTSIQKNLRPGFTCKYMDVARGVKHRTLNSERMLPDGKNIRLLTPRATSKGKKIEQESAKGFAHKKAWKRAADVFLEDMYTVWRALEGLPVWPSYYAAKLGYEHGGKISVNAPRMLTPMEALATVGELGKYADPNYDPLAAPPEPILDADECEDDQAELLQ